jgi:hypothetical protein
MPNHQLEISVLPLPSHIEAGLELETPLSMAIDARPVDGESTTEATRIACS